MFISPLILNENTENAFVNVLKLVCTICLRWQNMIRAWRSVRLRTSYRIHFRSIYLANSVCFCFLSLASLFLSNLASLLSTPVA